jgi:hypothetical protein
MSLLITSNLNERWVVINPVIDRYPEKRYFPSRMAMHWIHRLVIIPGAEIFIRSEGSGFGRRLPLKMIIQSVQIGFQFGF